MYLNQSFGKVRNVACSNTSNEQTIKPSLLFVGSLHFQRIPFFRLIEPAHAKTNKMVCAASEDSVQLG